MNVPTRIDVDGAEAAAYLPVAKRFLARLRAALPLGGARYYEFGSVKMHLWWTQAINKVRITAGVFGFIRASGVAGSLLGVIGRSNNTLVGPAYPASDTVSPASGDDGVTPEWNKGRTTAVFNDLGEEDPTHVYRAGFVYEITWDTPALGPGTGSTALQYMSIDGKTVILLRSWGNVLTDGQPAVVYNRLEWDESDPENPTWTETYSGFDCAAVAALISSPPGSAIYEAGNGLTAPHWLLEIDPGFPGTVTGGEETYRIASYGPYNALLPGQAPGQSDHILLKLDFVVPISATLKESGYTWSNTNEDVDPPTHDTPGAVLVRFSRYEVVYNTYSAFYKLNLLTGSTTMVRLNESELTRGLWLRAANNQADGDPEQYPAGVEVQQQWYEVDTLVYSGKFGTINPSSVFTLLTPDFFTTTPVGNVNTGGSAMIAFPTRALGTPLASATIPWAHQSNITSEYFLWASPGSRFTPTAFSTVFGNMTLEVYRDAALQVSVTAVVEGLAAPSAFPLPTGSQVAVAYTDAGETSRVLREYLGWVPLVVDNLFAVSIQNSATGKYQHEQVSDPEVPETVYTMYGASEVVHTFAEPDSATIMPHAVDDEKWYIDHPVDGPGVLREYERAEDPDTEELVVDYTPLTYPTELTFDSVEYPNNAFVRPFVTMGEGRVG